MKLPARSKLNWMLLARLRESAERTGNVKQLQQESSARRAMQIARQRVLLAVCDLIALEGEICRRHGPLAVDIHERLAQICDDLSNAIKTLPLKPDSPANGKSN
jgi:hypothetical protein